MTKYKIRSRELLDIVNDAKSGRLIISPYFQRALVWRELHKVDFIKTILLGYPFPQIFISRGRVDVDSMTSKSCVVDGQQRMNAILEYLSDAFQVDGRKYSDLSPFEKESFLTYEVPIMDLDLVNEDPEIIEIFTRLNRTFYSLSKIEKLATEYAPSAFMFVAKVLAKQIDLDISDENGPPEKDPNIPREFYDWAKTKELDAFHKWIFDTSIFSPYEVSRKIHLMFVLNLISTHLGGFFNRNQLSEEYLDRYSEDFPEKDEVVSDLNETANLFLSLNFSENSYWLNKANAFSLFLVLLSHKDALSSSRLDRLRLLLVEYEVAPDAEYALAAKEAVNNKRERTTRDTYIRTKVQQVLASP